MKNKLKRLLKNPKKEYKNIFFLVFRITKRMNKAFFDFIGLDYFSRPYPNHDVIITYLKNKKGGFFVECGGYDGVFQDPTYNLEKFKDWSGVIIEPIPEMYQICQKNRPNSTVYNYAAGSRLDNNSSLRIVNVGPMSIIKNNDLNYDHWASGAEKVLGLVRKELDVSSRTLDSILDEHFLKNGVREIDMLVIDVEGFEVNVLDGFSVEKFLPRFILIEIMDLNRKSVISQRLQSLYVLREEFSNSDYLFELKKIVC